jgi:hypothetical protein
MSGKLPPPAEMPLQQQERIKRLQCPFPITPTVQTAKLKEQETKILKLIDGIDLIEKQVDDLEKRFKITFSTKTQPEFDLNSTQLPYIEIDQNSSVNNIKLGFHLHKAEKGRRGAQGDEGDFGERGPTGEDGVQGIPGYYGIRG